MSREREVPCTYPSLSPPFPCLLTQVPLLCLHFFLLSCLCLCFRFFPPLLFHVPGTRALEEEHQCPASLGYLLHRVCKGRLIQAPQGLAWLLIL